MGVSNLQEEKNISIDGKVLLSSITPEKYSPLPSIISFKVHIKATSLLQKFSNG